MRKAKGKEVTTCSPEREDLYLREIAPLVQTLLRKCNENRIPFFCAFGIDTDENGKFRRGPGLKCTCLLPEVMELGSNDPCFADFVKIVNGAEALYPEEQPDEIMLINEEESEETFGKRKDKKTGPDTSV